MRNHPLPDDDDDISDDECPLSERAFSRLAYIKSISLDEALALGVRIPRDLAFAEDVKLYALHSDDGTTLGVTDSWATAYSAAVENNFLPLSVH